MERTNFGNWTREEIERQIDWLESLSRLVLFCQDKAFELGDGELRIAEFKEDKTWSEWETHEAPNLHVTQGRLVSDTDLKGLLPIIRISSDEALQLCRTDADPWSKDDVLNTLNYGGGEVMITSISKGKLSRIEMLTTRPTNPDNPFQIGLRSELIKDSSRYINKDEGDRMADELYESGEWVKYFPYKEDLEYWVPLQEIAYLKSLIKQQDQKKAREQKKKEASEKAKKETVVKSVKEEVPVAAESSTTKNYKVAALLAIILGSFGAHKFYMGKYLMGILYLALFWTWIPGIVGIIEGVMIFMGGQEKFESKL